MEFSHEDSLRLNVLLAQKPQALRIDESRMIVYGLTENGEASIPLNPNCRDDQYLKKVRELFSTHVLGSPGGYPVYLKRWTRSGQEREDSRLFNMLQLGEPEAVVAVVHTSGLTAELARLAWWAMPDADNARCMLAQPLVAASDIGRELADYLLEFLPFETEAKAMIGTVHLILQPGLIDEDGRQKLWKRAARKGSLFIGFLQAIPDQLPDVCEAHGEWQSIQSTLSSQIKAGNIYACLLSKTYSPSGQTFLKTVAVAMEKLADEDAAVALFDVIGDYFSDMQSGNRPYVSHQQVVTHAESKMNTDKGLAAGLVDILSVSPELRKPYAAMLVLSYAGEKILDSFFSQSDTVGSLMRRKLNPWTQPFLEQLATLRQ